MFLRMIKMDSKRCFHPIKIILVLVMLLVLTFLTLSDDFIKTWSDTSFYDIMWFVSMIMGYDEYKVVMAFALASLYTSSICSDDNSNYLRMILSRVDVTTYTQSRFIVNTIAIVSTCIAFLLIFAFMLTPFFQWWNPDGTYKEYYHVQILEISPILYLIMQGFQFGMIVAACGSIGLLFSAYQSNGFVSIGVVGLTYFCALSYIPKNTIFAIFYLSDMNYLPAIRNLPPMVHYGWGILYPTIVVVICGYLFYRRMKWRMENGYI